MLTESVVAANKAYQIGVGQYRVGTVDFTRLAQLEPTLVQAQDSEAQARGAIGLGLVQVYRALGGGWEIRLAPQERLPVSPQTPPTGVQNTPVVPVPDQKPAIMPPAAAAAAGKSEINREESAEPRPGNPDKNRLPSRQGQY